MKYSLLQRGASMVSESTRDALISILNEKDREIQILKREIVELREQAECEHQTKTYQEREFENNVPASYTCDDCGCDLEIPNGDEHY